MPTPDTAPRFPSAVGELLDSLRVGIVVLDASGRVVWLNRMLETYLAVDRGGLLGDTMSTVVRDALQHAFAHPVELAETLLASYETGTYGAGSEHEVLADDRREARRLAYWSQPVESGALAGGRIETFYDITERVEAEEQIGALKGFYEKLLENLPLDVVVVDGDLRCLYANPSAVPDVATREWLVGKTSVEYGERKGYSEDVKKRRNEALEAAASGDPVHFEETLPTDDGDRHFLRSVVPVRDDDGAVVQLLSYGVDITGRRRAEAAQSRSEARYKELFDLIKDIAYISTPDGRLLDINPAGLELFGYDSIEDMRNLDLAHDLYLDPWERAQLSQRVQRHGYVKDMVLRLRRRDGSLLTVEATVSALHGDDGELQAFLGILRDVTSQRQLEEQLRQAQKMDAVTRLAGRLSHDFNNLLTAINGYSDLILHQTPAGEPARAWAEQIRNAGRRAAELTGHLLTLSRPRGATPMPVNINPLIAQLEPLLMRMVGERVLLRTQLAPDLGMVRVDGGRMEQALINLTLNAHEAMPDGGRLTIETRMVDLDERNAANQVGLRAGAHLCLEVRDDGVGIDPEDQPRIFEPFFTTKEAGAGLGLATVYSIVRQAEGQIEVDSEPDIGTTVRIYLPQIDPAHTVPEPLPRPVTDTRGDEAILVVEDEAAVRRLLVELLDERGYRVQQAGSGSEALELLEGHQGTIDLLLSDVVMPGMSGPALADRLVAERPGLRVLYISGYADSVALPRDHPDRELLQKPFNPEALLRKVREVLDRPAEGALHV
ncbi:MAG: PAS domain-containing protein [Acidobacteriota bacterium]